MSSKGRILLVDDDPRNLKLLGVRLRAFGYEVLEAPSGEEALPIAAQMPLSLVLSDVMMPGIDGVELTMRLKADPAQEGLPIVLMTAYDDVAQRQRGLEAGADDFLGKPINPAELELRVRTQVRLRHFQEEARSRMELLATPPTPHTVGGGQVLVVEDDVACRAAMVRQLEAGGHSVVAVASLSEAREALAVSTPEVIIVDLNLPDGSGEELVASVCHANDSSRIATLMVVTGVEVAAQKLRVLRRGADDFLVKPVPVEELRARVTAQLRRARASRVLRDQIQRAQIDAVTDPLTGLFNRGYLDRDLTRRIERANSGHLAFSVALLDLDRFKSINDTHGHTVGDAVLREVAELLRDNTRENDLACRYGGEELCVVLPATPLVEAMHCIERVRQAVEQASCGALPPGAVTFSAGVAEWAMAEAATGLLTRADKALYRAKHEGRNRVEVDEPE